MIARACLVLAVAAAGAFAPGAAQAQQSMMQSQQLTVGGNTPQVCTLAQGDLRTGQLINFRGTDGDTLRVLELVDPRTLAAKSARATVMLGAVCNFPHRVRVETQDNGLWPIEGPVAPTTPDFATALPYRISFDWADRTGRLEADAKVRSAREARTDIDSPAAGELTLTIEMDAGSSNTQIGAPVLAGAYADTLRIYLEPR
ncbi:hypothetical protein [Tsuneonella amylolytica]|uniref:hypothetical protein n=1 Tax=Tsuneonella amylolytica TaxID=2338327 RepID=UPI000EA8B9F5|nr:hypothetical protein [Tsuneonella amylolytica]